MGPPAADSFSYSAEEVAQWHLHGAGEVTAAGDEVVLREGSDCLGVLLLSPDSFGERVVLSFRVKPNQHEGVLLAMLAVAARDGSPLAVPTDHRGAMPFWNGPAAASGHFMAAFHTGYHQPEAFMRRNAGGVDLARTLDPATTARWFEVEFGRDGARVWFRLDGVLLLDSTDPANLSVGAGQVGFRLRGPGRWSPYWGGWPKCGWGPPWCPPPRATARRRNGCAGWWKRCATPLNSRSRWPTGIGTADAVPST